MSHIDLHTHTSTSDNHVTLTFRPHTIQYICTKFGVESTSHFHFRVWTHTHKVTMQLITLTTPRQQGILDKSTPGCRRGQVCWWQTLAWCLAGVWSHDQHPSAVEQHTMDGLCAVCQSGDADHRLKQTRQQQLTTSPINLSVLERSHNTASTCVSWVIYHQ